MSENPSAGDHDDDTVERTVCELRLSVPRHDEELATDRLWGAGARAVEVIDTTSGERIEYHGACGVDSQNTVELRTVLADTEDDTRKVLGRVPPHWSIEVVVVDTTPADDWKAFVEPVLIDDELAVVPAWCAPPDGTRQVIWIDPGSAFGLGDHPTTQLSARCLRGCPLHGARVLDVGTGTGVLAIMAVLAGASEVFGTDISAVSIADAEANARRNSVSIEFSTSALSEFDEPFDVVVANILAPVLIELSGELVRLVDEGGQLVISGVLDGHYDHVVAALTPLEVVDVAAQDGWAAVTLVKPTSAS